LIHRKITRIILTTKFKNLIRNFKRRRSTRT
jgi:hypothetical protein